jgi:GntR family transcriptional regulator, arabinose operon transcriptional repressor
VKRPVDLGEADPRSYVRLAARLRKQILNDDLEPGRPVPSITTLSQEFGHARPTCGKAMRLLEREGLLIRVPGLGYYVTRNLVADSG